ncbi:MAG: hypothetical protein WC233_07935 [Sphaerochaeta sp.]
MESVQSRVNRETAGPGVVYKTATATLKPYETTVVVTGGAAVTITLPPPSETKGKIFTIEGTNAETHNVTVVGAGMTNVTLDADADHAVAYSDGLKYRNLAST